MFRRRVFDALESTKKDCPLGEQFCWLTVLIDLAPPPRRAPRRDSRVVCPGFGLSRWVEHCVVVPPGCNRLPCLCPWLPRPNSLWFFIWHLGGNFMLVSASRRKAYYTISGVRPENLWFFIWPPGGKLIFFILNPGEKLIIEDQMYDQKIYDSLFGIWAVTLCFWFCLLAKSLLYQIRCSTEKYMILYLTFRR